MVHRDTAWTSRYAWTANTLLILLPLLALTVSVNSVPVLNGGFVKDEKVAHERIDPMTDAVTETDGGSVHTNSIDNMGTTMSHATAPFTSSSSPSPPGQLVCSKCGHVLSSVDKLVVVRSPAAFMLRNISLPNWSRQEEQTKSDMDPTQTGGGYPVQTFRNPHGIAFDLLAVREGAQGAFTPHGQSFADATWFSGYQWRIVGCGECKHHVGWMYERQVDVNEAQTPPTNRNPPLDHFYGLVVDSIRLRTVDHLPDGSLVTVAPLNQTAAPAVAQAGEAA